MGNEPSKPFQFRFSIQTFNSLSQRKWKNYPKYSLCEKPPCGHIQGSSHSIELSFQCPSCHRQIFDGGLSKKARCICGTLAYRNPSGKIQKTSQSEEGFSKLFQETSKSRQEFIPELTSLTLGVFHSDLVSEFLLPGTTNFPAIFHYFLQPYFKSQLRYLEIGDFFLYGDIRFKVKGAFPKQGIVTNKTVVYCSDLLYEYEVKMILVQPVLQSIDQIQSVPSFFQKQTLHVHQQESFLIENLEYIATKVEPMDGIVTQNTEIIVKNYSLGLLEQMTLLPSFDDLSLSIQTHSKKKFCKILVSEYIIPYITGCSHVFSYYHQKIINGISFTPVNTSSDIGVCTEQTQIIFDGRLIKRNAFIGYKIFEYFPIFFDPDQLNERLQNIAIQEFRGTDSFILQTFPTHELDKLSSQLEVNKCNICICYYEIGEEIRTLPCFHHFHSECIDEWLKTKTICPICKRSVYKTLTT